MSDDFRAFVQSKFGPQGIEQLDSFVAQNFGPQAMAVLQENGGPSNNIYPPTVVETSSRGERHYDIFSRLMMDRIVFLGTPINDAVANIITAQLLFLEEAGKDIYLYINSPGGSVYAGNAILDTMDYVASPVNTIVIGVAASMAAIIAANGEPGKRSALGNSRIMIHQPLGGTEGQATDMAIAVEEINDVKQKMLRRYALQMGLDAWNPKDVTLVERLLERDNFISPVEAKALGIVDSIFLSKNATLHPLKAEQHRLTLDIQEKALQSLLTRANMPEETLRSAFAKVNMDSATAQEIITLVKGLDDNKQALVDVINRRQERAAANQNAPGMSGPSAAAGPG